MKEVFELLLVLGVAVVSNIFRGIITNIHKKIAKYSKTEHILTMT